MGASTRTMARYLFICALLMSMDTCAGKQDDDNLPDEASLDRIIAELGGKVEDGASKDEDATKEEVAATNEEDAEGKQTEEEPEEESEKKKKKTSENKQEDEE